MATRIARLAIDLQLCCRPGKTNLAAQLPQAIIGLRRGHKLETGTHSLRDPGAAGLLRSPEQLIRNFDRDFARGFHFCELYHIQYQHLVWYPA
jgi:hypothetical protein